MKQNTQRPIFDPQLIRRYDVSGPRYTSYPTADRFEETVGAPALVHQLGSRAEGGIGKPLSLYFHIPFCDTVCYYCACNKIVTKTRERADRYLDYLEREMALAAAALTGTRKLAQMHWGGGTPTYLSDAQIQRLCGAIRTHFELSPDGEYAIEVDPRRVSPDTVALLGAEGFNRMSVGVQDFDPVVQHAVNRVQSEDETASVINAARANGFRSVSVDLIYGLPFQNVARVAATVERVLALSPDRIAFYNYAHLPARFMPQRRINEADLPSAEEKLEILGNTIATLTQAGYVYIGMDHFAKPDDEIAVAQRHGCLYRNFQGYSTHSECDLLAFGVSAIGKTGPLYTQNAKTLDTYYGALDAGQLPATRGYEMNADDLMRYAIIQSLMCHFGLSFEAFELIYAIDFRRYFATEMAELETLQAAGLVEVSAEWITVTPPGRMLVRVIAMVFDRYLRERTSQARYSKVI